MRCSVSHPRFAASVCAALLLIVVGLARPAAAQDENLMFTSREDVERELVARINAETVRLDIAVWYLTQRTVSNAIINRHKAGVKVRVIGDRVSIFENDPNTTREFEWLATNGVPIRVRYNPTWFPEIIHWKAAIFVGQNLLEFGSANYTVFELEPFSSTNYNDENVLFTKDQTLLNAFKAQFDKYWADTTYFKDFNEAYRLERGTDFPVQLAVDRTPLEQDKWDDPLPPDMVWSQGSAFNNRLVSEINREVNAIDITVFRLSNSGITDALIAKHNAGVPVRVLIEPNEYNRDTFPEYELTRARIDQLWVAGVPVKKRVHQGLLHMKTLITSNVASIASSNFTNNWQRDHNYFLPASTKSALHQEMKTEFNRMWNDSTAYGAFQPAGPRAAALQAPANGATGVSTTPQFVWKRATWAVAFEVWLGTTTSNMARVATVPAVLTESPPATYNWTPSTPLQGGTTHVWRIVSVTNAGLKANSSTWSFTTTGSGGGGGGGTQSPFTGSPVSLPGTVQAENFDNGGSGVAYVDLSAGNSGGAYRTTDVDIEGTSDSGGGHNVGWMSAGEWLEYTVNVASAGTYTLEARVAASGAGGTFHVEFDGSNKTGAMTIPNTGGWQTWTTISKTVTLSAGTQVMRIALDANGSGGVFGNMNWVKVVATSTPEDPPPPPGSTPFTGTPVALPGTVQAENFDNGGQNVAYRDMSGGNSGGAYRSTDVDIEGTSDTGGGFNLGWMSAGEWLQYTVNVATAGTYTLELRVASPTGGGTFHVEFGGTNKTNTMTMPTTGGWQSWTTISKTVTLSAGTQVMRLVVDTTASNGTFGNLNWLRVVSGGSTPPPPPPPESTPFTGTPVALPATVQAENFDNGGANVAYRDNDTANRGGAYRSTAVDIEGTADAGGGFDVGWIGAGEWLNYTVNVPTAGTYTLQVRVASPSPGGRFHVEFDGQDKTGPLTMPNTGGWQTWTTLSTAVNLAAGTQIMKVVIDSRAADGLFGNINWIRVQAGTANSTTLFRQPYLQQVGSTTATLVWATRTPGRAEVWYQTAGQPVRVVSAASTLFATSRTGMAAPYYQHVAVLSPLAPSTAYSYEIAHDGVDLTAVTDRFVTAPPEGMGTVRFIAFGDSGVGSTEQRQLAALMAADDFDLALHGGDVTYGLPSSVGGGTYQTLHDWFFSIYEGWLRSRPIFPSIGNHDDEVSFALPYRDVFVLPENAVSSGYADHAERFYSFDYGPVHFVALDTERAFQDPLRRQAQLTWLDDDLRASAQPWTIVFFHRSPYSNGAEHGSDLAVRQAFGPIFERHGVQLVISAHDHDFERSVPWRQTTIADGRAVTYVVSGGGGARLYAVGQSATTARSVSAHHYVRATVGDCALTLEAVGLNGAAFDTYTLDRCRQAADVQPPTIAVTSPAAGAGVSGVTSVAVAASDDVRVEKVDLWVDGRLIAIDRAAPYAFSWDTRTSSDGTHVIEVRAYDIAGRISAASRSVNVANGTSN